MWSARESRSETTARGSSLGAARTDSPSTATPKKMTANLETFVTTMKLVAAILCCSRMPAYEIASPFTHEAAR